MSLCAAAIKVLCILDKWLLTFCGHFSTFLVCPPLSCFVRNLLLYLIACSSIHYSLFSGTLSCICEPLDIQCFQWGKNVQPVFLKKEKCLWPWMTSKLNVKKHVNSSLRDHFSYLSWTLTFFSSIGHYMGTIVVVVNVLKITSQGLIGPLDTVFLYFSKNVSHLP